MLLITVEMSGFAFRRTSLASKRPCVCHRIRLRTIVLILGESPMNKSAINLAVPAALGATAGGADAANVTGLSGGAADPTGGFPTGFIFISVPFVPFTFGSNFHIDYPNANHFVADITNGVMSITSWTSASTLAAVLSISPSPRTTDFRSRSSG